MKIITSILAAMLIVGCQSIQSGSTTQPVTTITPAQAFQFSESVEQLAYDGFLTAADFDPSLAADADIAKTFDTSFWSLDNSLKADIAAGQQLTARQISDALAPALAKVVDSHANAHAKAVTLKAGATPSK